MTVDRAETILDWMFRAYPEPSYIFDLETLAFLEVNDAAVRAYGYSRAEFLKRKLTDIRPPEYVTRLKKVLRTLTKTPKKYGLWRHVTKDGHQIDVDIIAYRLVYHGREVGIGIARDVSDREKALRELEERQALLAEAHQIAKIGTFSRNFVTGEIYWLPELYDIFGMEPKDGPPTLDDFASVLHPDDLPLVREIWERSETDLKPFSMRLRVKHKELGDRIVWVRARVEKRGRKPIRVIGTAQDITEVIGAERAMTRTERQYRTLLESAAQGVLTTDARGKITFANERLYEIFGYEKGELLGRSVEELIPIRLRRLHRRERTGYQKAPKRRTIGGGRELLALRKSGEEVLVEISLSPVATEEGVITMALVADISERLEARESARRYSERLKVLHEIDQAILQSLPVKETISKAVTEMNTLVPFNRAGVFSIDEDTGETQLVYAHGVGSMKVKPGACESVIGSLRRLREGRTREIADLRKLKEDPAFATLASLGLRSCLVIPMLVGDQIIGALALWYDQVGKRPAEELGIGREVASQLAVALRQERLMEALATHAEGLEKEVRERTQELEARNEDLQAFAYSVSHDLRAPLRAMRGFGEALLDDYGDELDSIGKDFIGRIVGAAEQMDDLIQDLLAYSRITREEITLEPVKLASVMRDVMTMVEADVQASGGAIDTSGTGTRVIAHHSTLVQVLSNLIANALKFTRDGETPSVKLAARTRNGVCRICVTDNGIGIREDHRERIFRMFERLHSREEFPGTGIGLAIVKRSMERLGGSCGVKSKVGKGSTFWVDLPVA